MCGIIGYVGHRPAVPVVMEGLRRLEYRGYDSAGIAYVHSGAMVTVKVEGKLAALDRKLTNVSCYDATTAMGHTRWATHGAPVERNAHPHLGGMGQGRLAIVHNGIIENFRELREALQGRGYVFRSDTDTEVMAHLIADEIDHAPTVLEGFAGALRRAKGSYSVVMIDRTDPDTLYAARFASPLLLGIGTGEYFVASDIPAFLPYTKDVVFIESNEVVVLKSLSWSVHRLDDLQVVEKGIHTVAWDMHAAQKDGYRHFMLKEIFEQPRVITDCQTGRVPMDGAPTVSLPELDGLPVPRRLHIVACGTSLHAGMWSKPLFESWARIPCVTEIASEFHCRDVLFEEGDVVLVISQSGETADTLSALRMAKARGCLVVGLCNVVGSSIAREASAVVYTQAGPEISVASTKAMCSQMTVLSLMALYYAVRKGVASEALVEGTIATLRALPGLLSGALPAMRETACRLARKYAKSESFFFLGRGIGYPLAMEGALKLKEISYIHAEGYAAGEMKHGPIALIDPSFPTVALAFDDDLLPKMVSNMQEVKARGGSLIAVMQGTASVPADETLVIPDVHGPLAGLAALPALQLFSYEMADYLGKDVDQPRNLAKSVTVE